MDAAGAFVVAFVFAVAFVFDCGATSGCGCTVTGCEVTLEFAGAAGAGVACCCGAVSGCDCRTERVPVIAGMLSDRAPSIKSAAAPIVILASSVCVPRGPKAVLETLLEKSAPASDLPGCKSTVMTRTMQARIKRPYKM